MRFIKMSKRVVAFSLALGLAALVAGCHHKTRSTATLYSQTGTGATGAGYEESAAQRAQTSAEPMQGQVSVPIYEEQLVVGTRSVESDGVRLRKQVTTETVTQPVQIQRETITVNREAASGGETSSTQAGKQSGSLSTPFEQGELVIRMHSQEPVVEKRIVPTGRIVVQTHTNSEQMNVQREVRKEKVDVEKMGDGQNVIISEKAGGQTSEAAGAAPAERQQIQGKGKQEYRAPVTTEESEPFPRPQPDGKETFPNLNKSPERE